MFRFELDFEPVTAVISKAFPDPEPEDVGSDDEEDDEDEED